MSQSRYILALVGGIAIATACWTSVTAQSGPLGYRPGDPKRLSGSYQLDRSRSDNPQQVVNRVMQSMQDISRDSRGGRGARRSDGLSPDLQDLIDRLDSPDTLAIDLDGQSLTITSSNAGPLTIDADSRDRTDRSPSGQVITTRADLYGDELTVSTSGNRGNDCTVRFEPIAGGLRVTRRINGDDLDTSVTAQSIYRRVADQPRWDAKGMATGHDQATQ